MKRNTAVSATSSLAMLFGLLLSRNAAAEVTLFKPQGDGWEFYTNGRVNAFVEYTRGDGAPVKSTVAGAHSLQGSGYQTIHGIEDPVNTPQGTIDKMRVASGYLSNILGFGVKRQLGETTVRGYISLWMYIQSDDSRKYNPVTPDAREGYIKFEGPWGSVTAGRQATLFSRGATEIDYLYGHGYSLGLPANPDTNKSNPAGGQTGFGLLANGWSAGIMYATPMLAGLQLNVGLYDPAKFTGSDWARTSVVRPEGELTYDVSFGPTGKLHAFVNGEYQPLYKDQQPNSASDASKGVGGGLRVEVGPVHVGAAGHSGRAVGLYYALDPTQDPSFPLWDATSNLRTESGFFGEVQLALKPVDINLGFGQSKITLLDSDKIADPMSAIGDVTASVLNSQTGISAGVVYHSSDWLHFDVDFFRAQFKWSQGEKQNVNAFNAGMTATW